MGKPKVPCASGVSTPDVELLGSKNLETLDTDVIQGMLLEHQARMAAASAILASRARALSPTEGAASEAASGPRGGDIGVSRPVRSRSPRRADRKDKQKDKKE